MVTFAHVFHTQKLTSIMSRKMTVARGLVLNLVMRIFLKGKNFWLCRKKF